MRSSSDEQFLEQRIVELPGEFSRLFLAEQVRTSDRSDKQRVAAEDPHRLVRLAGEDGDVLRRVPRRVYELDRQVADADPFAVLHLVVRVSKIRSRTGEGSGADREQLARTAHEVGVDVGLERVDDPQIHRASRFDVDVDVTPRIDDDRFAHARAGDQIRRLSQTFIEEALEHRLKSSCRNSRRIITPMPPPDPPRHCITIVVSMCAGAVAGSLGALLGIGGGVFLIPLLNVGLGVPLKTASGISLMTVIATSNAVATNSRRADVSSTSPWDAPAGRRRRRRPSRCADRPAAGCPDAVHHFRDGHRGDRRRHADAARPAQRDPRFFGRAPARSAGAITRTKAAARSSTASGGCPPRSACRSAAASSPACSASAAASCRCRRSTPGAASRCGRPPPPRRRMIGITALGSAPIYYARGQIICSARRRRRARSARRVPGGHAVSPRERTRAR